MTGSAGADAAALVALLLESPHHSGSTIDAVRCAGGPRAALEKAHGLFADAAEQTAAGRIAGWQREGIIALPCTDPQFPDSLRDIGDAPALLFVGGELNRRDQAGVAVIGTRQPTRRGVAIAQALARALVASGRTVISGLALGIDAAAHEAALEAGGRSIAVLGNGLHHIYPRANADIQARLDGLVSQFLPDHRPTPETFPKRNALMSGLSAATVIVEAGDRSGARIQARHALAQGRPLFVMAGLLDQQWARDLVARDGVTVISTPDELIGALPPCAH